LAVQGEGKVCERLEQDDGERPTAHGHRRGLGGAESRDDDLQLDQTRGRRITQDAFHGQAVGAAVIDQVDTRELVSCGYSFQARHPPVTRLLVDPRRRPLEISARVKKLAKESPYVLGIVSSARVGWRDIGRIAARTRPPGQVLVTVAGPVLRGRLQRVPAARIL